jgi:hypothetical protein
MVAGLLMTDGGKLPTSNESSLVRMLPRQVVALSRIGSSALSGAGSRWVLKGVPLHLYIALAVGLPRYGAQWILKATSPLPLSISSYLAF